MKVSVGVITYNHEKFIAQAMESVLMQVTDFDYEIVVGEDFSSDKTRMILDEYYQRYPEKIKLIYRDENVGLKRNFVDLLKNCKGKYIAVLSGDDYWTDGQKLQRQYEFLEKHPMYALIGNNAYRLINGDKEKTGQLVNTSPESFDFDTGFLILQNPCVASQVFFRNIVSEFPSIYYESTGEDRQLYILLSLIGMCRFDIHPTGIYRIHEASLTKLRNTYDLRVKANLERIHNAEIWNKYLENRFEAEVRLVRSSTSKNLVIFALKNRKILDAIYFAKHVDVDRVKNKFYRIVLCVLKFISLRLRQKDSC